jgi:hypothetical protein
MNVFVSKECRSSCLSAVGRTSKVPLRLSAAFVFLCVSLLASNPGALATSPNEAPGDAPSVGLHSQPDPAVGANIPVRSAVSVRIDPFAKTGTVRRELFGTAYIIRSGRSASPQIARELEALGVPVTSVSSGVLSGVLHSPGVAPDWREFDAVLMHLRTLGLGSEAQPLAFALGGPGKWFDIKNAEHRRLWTSVLVEAVRRSQQAGVRVRWWDLWIEPDARFGQSPSASYIALWQFFKEAAGAMKKADPTVKVGGPALAWPHRSIIKDYLRHCGMAVDFVSYHQYSTGNYKAASREILDHMAPRFFKEAAGVRELIRGSAANHHLPIFLTEYNINYNWDPGEVRQQTEVGAVYVAIATFHAAAGGVERAAIWSAFDNSRFGLVQGKRIAPAGHLLRKLAEWAPGDSVEVRLGDTGTLPHPKSFYAFATVAGENVRQSTVVLINASESETVVGGFHFDVGSGLGFKLQRCEEFVVNGANPNGVVTQLGPTTASFLKFSVPPMTVLVRRYSR